MSVYVVDNPEWNAMAMGNYSIYVFSGLLLDMDDDEVAIVLGHELAHATHEHSRRQFKKQMWIQLAALGLGLVTEQVEEREAPTRSSRLVGQFGALAWQNGYGRTHEDQADRVGLRYAYEAGYDITKGPRLWQPLRPQVRRARTRSRTSSSATTRCRRRGRRTSSASWPSTTPTARSRPAAGPGRHGSPPAAPSPGAPGSGGPATSVAGTDFLATPSGKATTRPSSAPPSTSRKEIRVGMSPAEVEALLGAPQAEIAFGAKTRWTYADLTVVFEAGKVRDVQF